MLGIYGKQTPLHWKPCCKVTRASVRHFSKTWPLFKPQPEQTKGHFPLAGEKFFSEEFAVAVGRNNVENIYGLDDETILIAMFAEFIEEEALRQLRVGRNKKIQRILNVGAEHNFYVVFEYNFDEKIHWKILSYGVCKKYGTSLVQIVGAVLDLSFLDALATVASMVNMQIENLRQLSRKASALDEGRTFRIYDNIPRAIYMENFAERRKTIEFGQRIKVKGSANQAISGAVLCTRGESSFLIPAAAHGGDFCIGRCKAKSFFLNQDKLDIVLSAQVIFCQDMRIALALQRILDETRGYNPTEIIVTAHLGEDLSVLQWSYFYGHDVVFLSAPTQKCMAMVKAYESYLRGARARSFRVHLGLLLHSPPSCDLQGETGVTGAETELLRGAVWLDTVERPTWLIAQVIKNAVSYEEYLAWGRALGIFKIPKVQYSETTTSSGDLVLFSAPTEGVASQPTSIDDVTVKHIFPLKRNVLIHGLKDAGKSIISLGITKAVGCGEALFGSFMSDGGGKVMYMNSETPKEDFAQRLRQFDLIKMLGRHLLVLSKYEHTATDCVFSLTDAIFREKVTALLQKHDCHYLILDNLTSLMDDGQATQAIAVSKVYAWVEALQQRGVCVILVHHTKDDSKAGTCSAKSRGSQDASIRGHTEIVLISSTQIIEQNRGPECVQLAAAQDGLTVGVLFKVCKSACILQKKTFWLCLPLGASEWQILAVTDAVGNLVEQSSDPEGAVGRDMPHPSGGQAINLTTKSFPPHCDNGELGTPNSPGVLADCTADERKVYEYVGAHGKAQNADVRKILGCETTKAGEVLNSLIERGLIKRVGNGPQTHYALS